MTLTPARERISISNRQRRLKIDTKLLSKIIHRVLDLIGDERLNLSVVLVDDATMAELNERYHSTSGPTDVLSFGYGEGDGELIISVERARVQARRFRTTTAREIVLYVVHGVLHLLGYNDLRKTERQKMRMAERRVVRVLAKSFRFDSLTM